MSWFKHHDIDYADILMMGIAIICGVPALVLAGYGVYSTVANVSTNIIASLI